MNRLLPNRIGVILNAAAVAMMMPLSSLAGTITLLDSTDTITIADDTGRAALACTSEGCTVTIRPPAGTSDFAQNFIALDWVEPGSSTISDSFCTLALPCSITAAGASIGFISDPESGSLGICLTCRAEDGTPQTAVTITWLNAAGATLVTDSIRMQSDTEVPEPASVLMILAGCTVVVSLSVRKGRPGLI